MRRRFLIWAVLSCSGVHAGAQGIPSPPSSPSSPSPPSSLEVGAFYHHVSNDYGSWKGGYGRLILAGSRNVWYFDARAQDAFKDRGGYGSLANVHTFSSRWYTQLGVGGGTGQYVLPRLRVDGSLNLKLGRARALVVTAGATYVKSKSRYDDKALFGSLFWYAGPWALVELGGRINWSNPGVVRTERVSGSLTLGRAGGSMLTLRGSAGYEGYQLTSVPLTLQRFRSQEGSLAFRQWFSRRWGAVAGGEWYHNPFYTRTGASLGLFRAW